jgi:hypothetical protein
MWGNGRMWSGAFSHQILEISDQRVGKYYVKKGQGSLCQHINNLTTLRKDLVPYYFKFMFDIIMIFIVRITCVNVQCHQTNNVNIIKQLV